MCLLTACRAEESEDKRRIVGAFMVKDDFFGSDCTDGIIPAHSVYRLRLPLDQQPLFWPHVAGELVQQHWGKTAFKYLSNRTEETILFSLKDLPSPCPRMRNPAQRIFTGTICRKEAKKRTMPLW